MNMAFIKEFGLEFEDWNEDQEYGNWANICKEHAKQVHNYFLDEAGQDDEVLCSVNGCKHTSDFYVNFK